MAYVITDECVGCRFAYCAVVCPVDAFHDASEKERLYINPETCIDCNACVSECPVDAIYQDEEIPSQFAHSIADNAIHAPKYPQIMSHGYIPQPLKNSNCKDPSAG